MLRSGAIFVLLGIFPWCVYAGSSNTDVVRAAVENAVPLNKAVKSAGQRQEYCPHDTRRQKASACGRYYDRLFEKGEVTGTIALGYLDRDSGGDITSPNDRYRTIFQNLTAKCDPKTGERFACGFEEDPKPARASVDVLNDSMLFAHLEQLEKKLKQGGLPKQQIQARMKAEEARLRNLDTRNSVKLVKRFSYTTTSGEVKTVKMSIKLCNPFMGDPNSVAGIEARARCEKMYANSMKDENITMYVGHSRSTGGPDFSLPVLKKNADGTPQMKEGKLLVDKSHYTTNRPGATRFFSSEALRPQSETVRPSVKQVYVISCASRVFEKEILENAAKAGYRVKGDAQAPANFSLATTGGKDNPLVYLDGTEPLRILESLGSGGCHKEIAAAYDDRRKGQDPRFPPVELEGDSMIPEKFQGHLHFSDPLR